MIMPLPKLELREKIGLEKFFDKCLSDNYKYVNDWLKSGWIGTFHLDFILSEAIEKKASDVHIINNQNIFFTILGEIEKQSKYGIPDDIVLEDMVKGILNNQSYSLYVRDLEYDTSYTLRFGPYSGRRCRANINRSFDKDSITFRIISDTIPTLEEIGITKETFDLFHTSSGVVLVCGATGSGKTTTLASIIRDFQLKRKIKIITIEKPIEFIYPKDGNSLIVQRGIPEDCLSFDNGLTSAMRSAPDIILIGEIRNKEEVDNLLRASETGHLALSTIHTSNNITTLNRIRSLYSGDEQKRVLNTLSDNLKGIINQVLIKDKKGGRKAIREILVVDNQMKKLISEDRFKEIRKKQEEAQATLEHLLVKAYLNGECDLEEARYKSPDPSYFDKILNDK